jgi:hypothetical protein
MSDEEDSDTKSTQTRWRYTNDILAGLLILTLCTSVAVTFRGTSSTPPTAVWTVFASAALIAAIWAFGTQAVSALQDLRGNN